MPNIETRAATAMTLITSADELTPWEVAWRQLAEARGNPFVTPDWYRSWLEHYDEDAEPFVIISCDSTGTCDGVLPLVRTGGSALRFAGADIGDQFHPACHESHELESTRRACAVLREHADEWSTAVFHGTEIDSDWLSGLRDGGSPLRVVTGLATAMPYVRTCVNSNGTPTGQSVAGSFERTCARARISCRRTTMSHFDDLKIAPSW